MERIGRRQLLLGAGAGSVALAGLALPVTTAAAKSNSEGDSLEGAWLVTHTDANGSAQAAFTFADGGALASRDINPPGNAQLGAWAKTGDRRFVATFWDGDTQGPNGPVFTNKIIVHGSWKDDHISGTFTFQIFDASGAPLQSGNGTFQGTRVEPGE